MQVTLAEVTKRMKSERVILKFSADWCGPCRVFKPVVEKVAKEMGYVVLQVDVDDDPDGIATHFGVSTIPHLEVSRPTGKFASSSSSSLTLKGSMPEEALRAKLCEGVDIGDSALPGV